MRIKSSQRPALALCTVFLGACSAPPLIDLSVYGPVQCTQNRVSLAAFKPTRPFDYLELRVTGWPYGEDTPSDDLRIDSTGQKCATATDRSACESSLASTKLRTGFGHGTVSSIPCCTVNFAYYLLLNSGDTVELIDRLDTLRGFFGTIDSPEEAAFLVQAYDGNYQLSCQHGVRAVEGGYEVALSIPATCYSTGTRRVWHVSTSGVVMDVMAEPFKDEGSCSSRGGGAI